MITIKKGEECNLYFDTSKYSVEPVSDASDNRLSIKTIRDKGTGATIGVVLTSYDELCLSIRTIGFFEEGGTDEKKTMDKHQTPA